MSRTAACCAALLTALAPLTAGGCRASSIRLAFVPKPGASYRYAIGVRSTTTTTLPGHAPTTHTANAELTASDVVVAVDARGSLIRVQLDQPNGPSEVFLVRLDRQAALVGIDEVNGAPAPPVAGVELTQLPPAALGAPPDRPLGPGDEWAVDQAIALPHMEPARVKGRGRLDEFGVISGRTVAITSSQSTVELLPSLFAPASPAGALPTASPTPGTGSTPLALRGTQVMSVKETRALDDGAIESSSAVSSGTFDIILLPRAGGSQLPLVSGQLTVRVSSSTRRLA